MMSGVGALTVLEQGECCFISISRTHWDAQVTVVHNHTGLLGILSVCSLASFPYSFSLCFLDKPVDKGK